MAKPISPEVLKERERTRLEGAVGNPPPSTKLPDPPNPITSEGVMELRVEAVDVDGEDGVRVLLGTHGDPQLAEVETFAYRLLRERPSRWQVKVGAKVDERPHIHSMQAIAHKVAVDSGWWESDRELPEILALVHSEVSEALEAYRASGDVDEVWRAADGKPEGVQFELADAVIRIMDYFERREWNLDEVIAIKMGYNMERPHRHGGKAL